MKSYGVFHMRVAADHEGRVPRSRSTARKDRAVAISVSVWARSPGLARAEVAPARSFRDPRPGCDLSTARRAPRGQPATADRASRPRGEPTLELGVKGSHHNAP